MISTNTTMAHAASVFRSAVGAPQADDTDEVAADAQSEDRADERDILIKVMAHVVVHELVQPFYDELGCGLPL